MAKKSPYIKCVTLKDGRCLCRKKDKAGLHKVPLKYCKKSTRPLRCASKPVRRKIGASTRCVCTLSNGMLRMLPKVFCRGEHS